MPPPCSEQRYSRHVGRRSRVPRAGTRPTLLIGENIDGAEDKAEESEDISPDAEKSEIRFTLQRRRDRNGKNDNSGNERDSNRQGRNRGGDDNNQDRRSGRDGDSNGRNRFRGGGDGPPFFREENDGGGGKSGDNGDGNGNGDGKGDGRGSGKGDDGKGGNDNNGSDKSDKGRGNNDGNSNGDNNDGRGGNGNGNGEGRDGRGGGGGNGGRGGGPPGGNRGGPDPSPDDTSTSTPPPPPSTTTSIESTTTEEVSTTTTSEISTSTPAPEATTTTTISSTSQTSTIPLLTPLPALADTAPSTSIDPAILVPSDGTSVPTLTLTSASVADIADSTTLAPTPTNTNPANSSDKGNGRHRGFGDNNKGNDKEGGLNPTSERILVAAGSIGAFIVFLFIGWMVYRTLKKSKQPDRHDKSWLSKLVPFRGRPAESNAKALGNSYEPKESLPAYDFGNNNSMEAFGYYDQAKFAPLGSEGVMYQSIGTLQNGRVVWQTQEVQQPLQPQASLQSQYPGIADQTLDMSDVNSTMRSRMPGPYYNQSEFARQPSDAYNPAQRQVYRASEISSLSSGFGDGDIIMPPPNIIPKPPIAPVANNTDTNNRPFSWMSRTASVKKRETVSTTMSEHPARFRSVNSWVDQQKDRLKRANSRSKAREEVPAIPQISYK